MGFLENTNVQFYLAAYFIGGIPFGLLLTKFLVDIDIRNEGSGGIGATNVLRVLKERDPKKGKTLAAATLILDALKGVAVLLTGLIAGVPESTLWAIAFLAVVGHCFSPYLIFEGGKGVATGFGVLAFMMPLAAAIGALVWFAVGRTLRISSLSSLSGLLAVVLAGVLLYPDPAIETHAPLYLIAFIILYKHFPNLVRLIRGEEKPVV